WLVLPFGGGALLLALLALSAAAIALTDHADAADRSLMLLNLLIGIFGVSGAIGYALNRPWGIVAFALSTVGHGIAHVQLYLNALSTGRPSSILAVGLAIVPLTALCLLAGMVCERWIAARRPSQSARMKREGKVA